MFAKYCSKIRHRASEARLAFTGPVHLVLVSGTGTGIGIYWYLLVFKGLTGSRPHLPKPTRDHFLRPFFSTSKMGVKNEPPDQIWPSQIEPK